MSRQNETKDSNDYQELLLIDRVILSMSFCICQIYIKLASFIDYYSKVIIIYCGRRVAILKKIIDLILRYLEKNAPSAISDESDSTFIRYGIEITLSSILNIVIIISLSVVFHSLLEGVLFLAVFITTRQFTGGFHANTYLRCNIVFSLCFLTALGLYKFVISLPVLIAVVIYIADIVTISIMCPVENLNKPIAGKRQYYRFKIISVFLFLSQSAIGILLIRNGHDIGKIIIITLQIVTFLCIISLTERRRS